MKELKFRCLRAEDVNARCDMAMLDEAVGAFNWKREHSRDNANCTISIWDDEKNQWVSKEVKAKIKEHKLTVMCSDGKFDVLLSWLDREGYFFMTED